MKQANHDHRRVDQSGGAFLNLTYAAVLAAGIAALAMIEGTDSREPEPVLATVSRARLRRRRCRFFRR